MQRQLRLWELKMKRVYKLIMLILLILSIFTGCGKPYETYENGVPTYFLEPEGYVIAQVDVEDNYIFAYYGLYGYILEEDYQAYLDGEKEKVLVVKHPYKEGEEISTSFDKIISIKVGTYRDMRYQ